MKSSKVYHQMYDKVFPRDFNGEVVTDSVYTLNNGGYKIVDGLQNAAGTSDNSNFNNQVSQPS